MIPKKHILQYLEVDFNILPMISTIYDQLKIHTMECLRPQRWSGGTGGTEVPTCIVKSGITSSVDERWFD